MNKNETGISKSCKCGKIGDFPPIVHRVESMPIDQMKQKIGRNHCLQVCKSWFDFEHQYLHIEHMINVNATEIRSYTFKEIAAEFGWKAFKISEDQQTIYPIFYKSK